MLSSAVVKALALAALGGDGEPRPTRHSELTRRLAGVSQKMLTQTLRSLERDGLLTRTVAPTVPVTVSYELTPLGSSLQDEVLTHRAQHDTGAAPALR